MYYLQKKSLTAKIVRYRQFVRKMYRHLTYIKETMDKWSDNYEIKPIRREQFFLQNL